VEVILSKTVLLEYTVGLSRRARNGLRDTARWALWAGKKRKMHEIDEFRVQIDYWLIYCDFAKVA